MKVQLTESHSLVQPCRCWASMKVQLLVGPDGVLTSPAGTVSFYLLVARLGEGLSVLLGPGDTT